MRKRLLKIFLVIAIIFAVLSANQYYYLKKVQYTCTEKINRGENLNFYEVCSAMQTHTAFWMFGWIIEPATAKECFNKQFHIKNPIISFKVPEDDVVKKAKEQIKQNKTKKVQLIWKTYDTRASIFLNGSTIYRVYDNGLWFYCFEVPFDYKPGTIEICGIKLSETVFDYLENKNILGKYTRYYFQRI